MKTRLKFPNDPTGWHEIPDGAEVTIAPGCNVRACQKAIAESLAPAPVDAMERWLAELSKVSARAAESEEEGMLTLAAYTKRLVKYPGDIVRDTLENWEGVFFPKWGELKPILDARVAHRGTMQTALSVHLAVKLPQAEPSLKGLNADQRHAELTQAAFWARKSGDHERAKELEDRAVEEFAAASKGQ